MSKNIEEIDSFDDFISIVDGDSIATSDVEPAKPTVFTKESAASFEFLDEDENKEEEEEGAPAPGEGDKLDDILEELEGATEDETPEEGSQKGRRKVDKSGLVDTFSKLIDEEVLFGFEDDKPLEDYSVQDFKDLIKANIEQRENDLREQTPKEFFEALPTELQQAAKYVASGGKDLKGLFSALSQVEDVRSLDPLKPQHQESIVRQYLQATVEDKELAEEQLDEWKEAGLLERKASQLKPKLDKLNERIVEQKLQQQDAMRERQIQTKQKYVENVTNTLKEGALSGLKIDSKTQKSLYEGLISTNHQSISGRPTNELGKLLEEYQFSENPRYDLIAEALWLLKDPDGYRGKLKENFGKEFTQDTVKKLKTEESRKQTLSTEKVANPQQPQRRQLTRPKNIFGAR